MNNNRRPSMGLTMAELVLALGLLATILVSVVGLFTTLLGSSAKSTNQTVGHYFAHQKLEEAVLQGGSLASGDTEDYIYSMDASRKTRFAYVVEKTDVSGYNVDTGYRGGYYILVRVYWWDGDLVEARAGQGLLYTSIGRFCYPGEFVP